MTNYNEMFNDIFQGFGNKINNSNEPEMTTFENPFTENNLNKIFTFSRSFSNCKLKETVSGKFIVIDPNGNHIGIFSEIKDAKIAYIRLVVGDILWDN